MGNGKNGFPMIFCGKPIGKVINPIGRHMEMKPGNCQGCITGICRETKLTNNQTHFFIEFGDRYISIGEGTMVTKISAE